MCIARRFELKGPRASQVMVLLDETFASKTTRQHQHVAMRWAVDLGFCTIRTRLDAYDTSAGRKSTGVYLSEQLRRVKRRSHLRVVR